MSGFVCDICIGQDGLFKAGKNDDDQLSGPPDSTVGVTLSIDPAATDPYVHTCMPFKTVKGISRQQKCVMCLAEGRRKATSVYCGLCCVLSTRDIDRYPSCHAYCLGGKYQCFSCHVANCFLNQMKNGNKLTQRIVAKKPRISTLAGPQLFITKTNMKKRRLPNTVGQQPINSSPQSDTSTASEESDDASKSPPQRKKTPQKTKSTPQQKNKPPQRKTQQRKNTPP
jgi:hypothetical protein